MPSIGGPWCGSVRSWTLGSNGLLMSLSRAPASGVKGKAAAASKRAGSERMEVLCREREQVESASAGLQGRGSSRIEFAAIHALADSDGSNDLHSSTAAGLASGVEPLAPVRSQRRGRLGSAPLVEKASA